MSQVLPSPSPKYASVIIENGFDEPLTYLIPDHFQAKLQLGQLVKVPLRRRIETGVVLSLSSSCLFEGKVKEIESLIELPPVISASMIRLAQWMSHYYCCSLRRVLKVIIPKVAKESVPTHEGPLWVTRQISLEAMAKAAAEMRAKHPVRAKVLDVLLKTKKGILMSALLEKAQVSLSPVHTLEKQGLLKITTVPDSQDLSIHRYFRSPAKQLNHDQAACLKVIKESLDSKQMHIHLLYGVTGSGKTEVYLQAIEHALSQGGSCLLLVPEISLTPQTVDRLRARFEQTIAILHYRLSGKHRSQQWESIRSGKLKLIVGARSAVFCPCEDLKLIIIDEEHESSYKSEESPHYHARAVAIQRAHQSGASVILGSATPSLESYSYALEGRYKLLKLSERATKAQMPQVHIVDMIPEYERAKGLTLFSSTLIEELKATFERGEQAMLFLNRRGYFTQTQCLHCGHSLMCPHCDLNLTYHRSQQKMICHLCHYSCNKVDHCPHCKTQGQLKFRGWGTEHVQISLNKIFPDIKSVRIDADTTRHKGSLEQLIREFRTHKADVIIGTQMIAKGHHFPGLTLVAVLNPDAQLLLPDFRASEHLFQLLVQVFGRSGRSHLPGKVLVQTAQKQAHIFKLAAMQDYLAFADQELKIRQQFNYPPTTHIIKVTVKGMEEKKVAYAAHELHSHITQHLPKNCLISSPGEGAWRKIQDEWRQVFLIKAPKPSHLSSLLSSGKQKIESSYLRIDYDVDSLHIG